METAGIRISAGKSSEAGALAALRTAVARDMTRQFGEGHWSACPARAEVLRQLRASHVLVAWQGADLVGTVRVVRALPWAFDSSCFTPAAKPLYLLGLAVAPHCRGRGIGRQLVEAAKDTARSWNAQALWLDAYEHAAGAGPFYVKCGFRRVGRNPSREVPLVYFEWLVATGVTAGASKQALQYP
jgi:GNAT superfamily N-acetyltransferase